MCLKRACVLSVMCCDVGWLVAVCVIVCVLLLFNACDVFVSVLSGVVWLICLHYCLCAVVVECVCALCVVYGVML